MLRRILRRAVRHAWLLGRREPTLAPLTDVVVEQMGDGYPELVAKARLHPRSHRDRGAAFLETIEGGLRRLEEMFAAGATTISGRRGVQAVRHLRVPDRPDPDHRRRARRRGRPRGVRARRWSEQRERSLARCASRQQAASGPGGSSRGRKPGKWRIAQARQAEVRRLRDDRGGHRRARLPPGRAAGRAAAARRIRSTPSRAAR